MAEAQGDAALAPLPIVEDGAAGFEMASPRWQTILLQTLFSIVWSYQLLFSQESYLSQELQLWVILGLLSIAAGLILMPPRLTEAAWFPASILVGNTLLSGGLIYLSGNSGMDIYLAFFLVMLIAALAKSVKEVIAFSSVLAAAYGAVLYMNYLHTHAISEGLILRLPMLLIMSIFYAVNVERVRKISREKAGLIDYIGELKRAHEEKERLIRELQAALTDVKTLSGLLPICAHCKSVRDDKGYWQTVESFIRTHGDVDFSHSICPRCLQKHFPA